MSLRDVSTSRFVCSTKLTDCHILQNRRIFVVFVIVWNAASCNCILHFDRSSCEEVWFFCVHLWLMQRYTSTTYCPPASVALFNATLNSNQAFIILLRYLYALFRQTLSWHLVWYGGCNKHSCSFFHQIGRVWFTTPAHHAFPGRRLL